MTKRRIKIIGFLSLLGTTLLWGTSFAFIKLSVTSIDPSLYTFIRTMIASLILLPIVLVKYFKRSLDSRGIKYGFMSGVAYSTGLYLQSAGTFYVDPSVSAFITGLSTIHVHLYTAFIKKKYSYLDAISLAVAVTGLYYLTSPRGGFGIGEILVFLATFAWATQIILISLFGHSSLPEFLFGTFISGSLFTPLAVINRNGLSHEVLLYLVYLAVVCSIGATLFQVIGQRYISAHVASLIFLLEPVFALLFSVGMGLETAELYKLVGGALIIVSLTIAVESEMRITQ